MSYFKSCINEMSAYVPGEQPKAGSTLVKLNTNENPYPPSPHAMLALQNFDPELLRAYPDPIARDFSAAVSELIGYPQDWILPGNGSDNLIVMLARSAGGPIVAPVPTFPYYHTQAEVEGVGFIGIDFREDFSLPVDELIKAAGAVTFVANPGSPIPLATPLEELERLAAGLQGKGILVIDEAYADFADSNAIELPRKFDNVMVFRTLSKSYSLASLRLGYAVANPQLLEGVSKAKEIYNVGVITQVVGKAAIEDQEYMLGNVEKIRASRKELSLKLTALGWSVMPSQTNFLLASPPAGDAEQVAQKLKAGGILVRYFKHLRLADKLRITIGTPEQNARLLEIVASK